MKRYHGNRSKMELEHNILLEKVKDNLIFVLPGFKHDHGDPYHHRSMMRTVLVDKEGEYVPWTGPPHWKFEIHEILDAYIFYPINKYLMKRFGDGKTYHFLRNILGFFWGFNCNFPPKDVVLYTAWSFHGCPALQVLKKIDGKWVELD